MSLSASNGSDLPVPLVTGEPSLKRSRSPTESEDSDQLAIDERSKIAKLTETNVSSNSSSESEDESDLDDFMYDELALKEFQFEDSDLPEISFDKLDYFDQDPIPPLKDIKITKNVCSYVRNFLKTRGFVEFLEKTIPVDPSPDDILYVTNMLGYTPRYHNRFFKNEHQIDEFMQKCILFLQKAMNRVLKMRTRLPSFHKIEHLVEALEKAENVLVLTGAGISTSLGIPDFRSSQGFYSRMKHLGLEDPQDVFSLDVFKRSPEVFYSIAHMILPPDLAFTPLHGFIKLLQDKNKLLRNYTQNIDNLEANAGVLKEKLVQCHGSFATASCITCKYKVPGETLFGHLRRQEIAYCPFCQPERKVLLAKVDKMEEEGTYSRRYEYANSFGVMKPDITFFGEDLPELFHSTIKTDIDKCDLLICIGTSLKVAPVSEIVNLVPNSVPQILINKDPINHAEFDIDILGYCDQAITWLTGKRLGWEIKHKDFDKILNSGLEIDMTDEAAGLYIVTDEKQREAIRKEAEVEQLREEKEKQQDGDDAAGEETSNL
ncbi:hypothetical protein OGAPHI_006244 [Ogataea philodendri]|uniref:Deacetylase sirtuin-type domain-containing protein n=2 Tax=Saccharomycotina TaxID=147537 RepID=A0A9P8NXG2_9ASCO|nr:uncharacterized protein OGAPHI_006244 [Ogataea philodendri]KAH3662063.1 hypothetical protein OGAPHI_006244 [Ogataea philodendri]